MAGYTYSVNSSGSQSAPVIVNTPQSSFSLAVSKAAAALGSYEYQWAQGVFAQTSVLTDQAVTQFLAAANQGLALASTTLNQYTGTTVPEMAQLANEAGTYSSTARQQYNMGAAGADASQAANANRINTLQDLQAYGVDPSSGMYADLDSAARTAAGATEAGAQNQAQVNTENTGRALLQSSIAAGQQLPGDTVNALNSAYQGVSGAENAVLANANTGAALTSAAAPFFNAAAQVKLPTVMPASQSASGGISGGSPAQPNQNQGQSGQQGQQLPGAGVPGGKTSAAAPSSPAKTVYPDPATSKAAADQAAYDQGTAANTVQSQFQTGNQSTFDPNNMGSGIDSLNMSGEPGTAGDANSYTNGSFDSGSFAGAGALGEQGLGTDYAQGDLSSQGNMGDANSYTNGSFDTGGANSTGFGANDTNTSFNNYGGAGSSIYSGGTPSDFGISSLGSGFNSSGQEGISNNDNSFNSFGGSENYGDSGFDSMDNNSGGGTYGSGIDSQGDIGSQGNMGDSNNYNSSVDSSAGFQDNQSYNPSQDTSFDTGSGQSYTQSGSGAYGGYAKGGVVPQPGRRPQMMAGRQQPGQMNRTTGGFVPRGASPSQGQKTDDISARLNAGEFVLPRDVVNWKGQEFFQKLIAGARKARVTAPAHGKQRPGGAPQGPPRFVSHQMGR